MHFRHGTELVDFVRSEDGAKAMVDLKQVHTAMQQLSALYLNVETESRGKIDMHKTFPVGDAIWSINDLRLINVELLPELETFIKGKQPVKNPSALLTRLDNYARDAIATLRSIHRQTGAYEGSAYGYAGVMSANMGSFMDSAAIFDSAFERGVQSKERIQRVP